MYGLQFFNDITGELVMSDSSMIYTYLGKAQNTAIFQSARNGAEERAGHSEYQINYDGNILVAVGLKPGMTTRFIYSLRSGNTHTIHLAHCYSDDGTVLFNTQYATDVYVFVLPSNPNSIYGMTLYDDNQNLLADLSRYPLTPRLLVSSPDGIVSTQIPSDITNPAFIGMPQNSKYHTVVREMSSGSGWELSQDSTSIRPRFVNGSSFRLEQGEVGRESVRYRPASALLFNLVNLPQ